MIRTRTLHAFNSVLAGIFLLLVAAPSAFAESAPIALYKSDSNTLSIFPNNGVKLSDRDGQIIYIGQLSADGNCTSEAPDENIVTVYFLQLNADGEMEGIFGDGPDGSPWTVILKSIASDSSSHE